MITIDDLIELRPRKIKYKDKNYYVKVAYDKYAGIYMMDLYKERDIPLSDPVRYKDDTDEDFYINQHYDIEHTERINDIVYRLDKEEKHSPTYIQDVIKEFFKMYLERIDRRNILRQEKETQLKNYKEWDGVIE